MTNRRILIFTAVFCSFFFSGTAFSQQPAGLSRDEQEEIRALAVQRVQNLADWMNYVTQKGTTAEDVQDCISQIFQEGLFYDSLVTLEDDLFALRADTLFPKDVTVPRYLNDWHFFYNKSMDGKSITFSDLRLSEFARKDHLFIRVYFQARYRERHRDFDQDFPARRRIATLRIEKKDEKWLATIAGISFYREKKPDGSLQTQADFEKEFRPFVKERKNKLPVFTTQSADSTDIIQAQLKLQREFDSLYADAVKTRLLSSEAQKRKEELYRRAVEKGDSLFQAGQYPEAIESYSEARAQKPFETWPRDKIRELGQLMKSPAENPALLLAARLEAADAKLKIRDYEEALQAYQLVLSMAPANDIAKEKVRSIDLILRRKAELRALYMAGSKKLASKAFSASAAAEKDNPDFYLERAKFYLHSGERKKALSDLNKAISLDGHFKDAFLLRAAFRLKEGELPLAVSDYTALQNIEPRNALHHELKARVLLAAKDPEAAEKEYSRALELEPENTEFLCAKADLLRKRKDMAEALALAEKALGLKPNFPPAHFQKGLILMEQGEEKAAGNSIQRARRLGLNQAQVQVLDDLAAGTEAQAMEEEKSDAPEKAIRLLRKSLVFRPANPQAWLSIARLNQKLNQTAEALKAVDQALFVREDFVPGYLLKGKLLLNAGEALAGTEPFYRARRYDRKNVEAALGLGKAYAGLQRLDSALVWFADVIRLDPGMAEAYLQRGICHFRKENYVRASQDFESALKNNSRMAEAHFYLGKVNKAYNRFDQAIDDFEEAAALGFIPYECFLEIGAAYEKLAKEEKAKQFYTKAIAVNPDKAEAYLLRGLCRLRDNEARDAMADLDEGLKIDTAIGRAPFRVELGFLCLQFDNSPKAEICFLKALSFDRYHPRANFGLGICQFHKGETGLAMRSFEQGLIAKKLDFQEIKKMPGMKKILKAEKFKELKETYLR